MIYPKRFELLPTSRTKFHGPKDATEVRKLRSIMGEELRCPNINTVCIRTTTVRYHIMMTKVIYILCFSGTAYNIISSKNLYKWVFGDDITKAYLYNFDPLNPHFYIVKLGFTGVCIIFLNSAQ